ncbi:hypothetical protein MMC30_004722 [Trapelia coarctata]|nr:hypothetical protein [Trapelia coarctata]
MENAATQTPDGRVHNRTGSQKLQGQAATAALYATKADRDSKKQSILDSDNRLSSASAATSLKYATAQELPSFPTVGISDPDSSAGVAATLANANQKSFEHWKPESSSPANQAAHLAVEYKAPPSWHPEMSAAGSKAAVLAARKGGDVNIWKPEATPEGNSAAGQAMRMKNLSPSVDYGYTEDGRRRALVAATDAMSGRGRSGSTPVVTNTYPDSANSAANALNAATLAHRPSTKSRPPVSDLPGLSQADATRIHDAAITNLGREMYTSHPPVAPEIEEQRRQAGIRAAAVVMAKQMYAVQQKALEEAAGVPKGDSHYAANSVHGRKSSMSSASDEPYQAKPQYAHLQEAAQKLAAERLAKLYDENAEYKKYYGMGAPVQSRNSIRGRLRRRASSDSDLPGSDEARSKQIRSQMSIFNNKLAQVDRKKQQNDRDALMAAAQRNVSKKMQAIDEKVFADTGKVSPAMMTDWETKARARAEAESSARMVNHGKVNIGGGRFMDQSEVDAIAAARVQPTLDEITEKAETQRALEEQRRQEELERRRIADEKARSERQRELRTKEEWKRFKEEEKRAERARKEEEKQRKIEEKRQRDEEKRLREEEKRKSKSSPVGASIVLARKAKETPAEKPAPTLDPISHPAPNATEKIVPAATAPANTFERDETAIEEGPAPPREETEAVVTRDLEPIAVEEFVPAAEETIIPENVDRDTAEDIVARVFAAPVITSSGEVTVPDLPSKETIPSTESEISKPNAANATSETTRETATTKPVEKRIAPPPVATDTTTQSPPASPKQEHGTKLTSWLKNKLRRGSASKSSKPATEETLKPLPESSKGTTIPISSTAAPVTSTSQTPSSVREVAMAGKQDDASIAAQHTLSRSRSRSTSISSLSSDEPTALAESLSSPSPQAETALTGEVEASRGRSESQELRKMSTATSGGEREEEFEEAKDHFDAEKLPVPSFPQGRVAESPVRDSKFVEIL